MASMSISSSASSLSSSSSFSSSLEGSGAAGCLGVVTILGASTLPVAEKSTCRKLKSVCYNIQQALYSPSILTPFPPDKILDQTKLKDLQTTDSV